MNQVIFTEDDIKALKNIIEADSPSDLTSRKEMDGIVLTLRDYCHDKTLELLILNQIAITIMNMRLEQTRTMDKIFEFLKDFCTRNHIRYIMVKSAQTREMADWCINHKFQPVITESLVPEDKILGEYRFDMANIT